MYIPVCVVRQFYFTIPLTKNDSILPVRNNKNFKSPEITISKTTLSQKIPTYRTPSNSTPDQTLLHLFMVLGIHLHMLGYIFVLYVFSHGFFRGSFQGENFGAQDSIFPGRCSCSSGGLRRLVPHPQRFSARRRPRRAQPTQLLVEPKKTTVAEVQVEWRCGEVWFNNQKIVRDDDFFFCGRETCHFFGRFL